MNEFIEKLTGRLEELKELHAELIKDGLEEDFHSGCEGMCVDIIEIVNELAEEYNNYFCEWEQDDKEIDVYYTKCGQAHIFIYGNPDENNHVYCPYCGKKIKIALYQPKGE